MRKLLEAEYANQQLERARQRLQGHREGMQDAIRMNAEQLAQQKKSEADVLREQSRRISAYVAMQQQQHVERAKRISSVPASRRRGETTSCSVDASAQQALPPPDCRMC